MPSLAYGSFTYVDDGCLVEPNYFLRMVCSGLAYNWVLSRILGAALNMKKMRATGMAATVVVVWGIQYDLTRIAEGPQFGFITLSVAKMAKMRAWAKVEHVQPGARRIRSKDHQSLVGTVQWWSSCSAALRSILPMLHVMSAATS